MSEPDARAAKPYRDDPDRFSAQLFGDVEIELDQKLVNEGRWVRKPLADGNGVGYLDGRGGAISLNRGYPEGWPKSLSGNLLQQGPYVKIMPKGIRVPLAGNPALPGNEYGESKPR